MNQRIANEALSSIHSEIMWARSYLDDFQIDGLVTEEQKATLECLDEMLKNISKSCAKITKAIEAKPDPLQEPPPR